MSPLTMKVNHRDDVSKAQTQCHPAFDDAYEVVSAFFDCISNGNDAAETIYGGHVGIVFQDLIFCVPQSRLNVLCEHSNWLCVLKGFNSYFGSWRVVENAVLGVRQGDEASSCTRASGRPALRSLLECGIKIVGGSERMQLSLSIIL